MVLIGGRVVVLTVEGSMAVGGSTMIVEVVVTVVHGHVHSWDLTGSMTNMYKYKFNYLQI